MPFGLILGPDSPSVDELCGGILKFSRHWILTNVCITQANFLASTSSTHLLVWVFPFEEECSLTNTFLLFISHSFGKLLNLVHLRCKSARSVSYYALFQGWMLLGKPPGCLCTPTSFITERSFRGLSWWSGLFSYRRWSLSSIVSLVDLDILRPNLVFKVCLDLVSLSSPAQNQCFTPKCPANRCASTHFRDNQLVLGSSGISSLTTTYPMILQDHSVCTST